ncbi:MAG: hypothetical protein K8I30_00110 [Anaerolineae bacterium]|nr:hypothetical protein [Anaerolineae bacterium]
MSSHEKTQPKSPFKVPPQPEPPLIDPEADTRRQGGCMLYGLIGTLILGLALVIVLLAAAAGWTSGQRLAQEYATATQNAEILDQLGRIPGDVSSRNTVMLNARLQYLVTLTPGVSGLPEVIQTATALYQGLEPTATLTPAASPSPAEVTASPTSAAQVAVTAAPGGQYDLPALLEDARRMVSLGQYDDAIDLLDALIAVDATFQRETVRALMLEALSTQALNLFRTGSALAKAINLTERAKEFGLSGESELHFEQYVAGLYLQAKSAVGTNYPVAIQALSELYRQAPYYMDVEQLLYQQYVGYGDAWVAGGDYCPAVVQYQNALNMFNSGEVAAKRDNAQIVCAQGTPTPGVLLEGQTPIAPIGVPSS